MPSIKEDEKEREGRRGDALNATQNVSCFSHNYSLPFEFKFLFCYGSFALRYNI